ncbi:related to lactonohydrolase [Rhynchosporium secalis]|uniref:Related to lactonohydrolase n=1 Tax=Rhynchosporium secalis TaxID=38038 RepID=A0A1E1M694_RHYSE|nr:related to lactonohydrolase [Rhynchosporium secalis]
MRSQILLSITACTRIHHANAAGFSGTNATSISIPSEFQYLLPDGYTGNLSQGFVNTRLPDNTNSSLQNLFKSAAAAPFVSYSQDFDEIMGTSPDITLLSDRPDVGVVNLDTGAVSLPAVESTPLTNPNGGYYFNGSVYFGAIGNFNNSYGSGVFAMDTKKNETRTVLNTYLGLPFNGVDDITWATKRNADNTTSSYMFFTDVSFQAFAPIFKNRTPLLPNAVWRWDPQLDQVLPVISKNDVGLPNGIRVNAENNKLYVTDSGSTVIYGAGAETNSTSPAIYEIALDDKMRPVNKRLFGIAREGLADGLKIDDLGRVWTGEYEGVTVRSREGKVLGIFNSQYFQKGNAGHLANFALAGDKLVLLSLDRLWMVRLNQTVTSKSVSEI